MDFVSQKRWSKYHTGFLDVQNANLFVMYVKARFIKFVQTKSYMVPSFYFIISSCSMIDLILNQLLNYIPKFLAYYVNCLRLHHQMRSEVDGFHSCMRFSRCIHKIDHLLLN
jgi:hypothetical protein